MKTAAFVLAAAFALIFSAVVSAADPRELDVNALEEKPGMLSVVITAIDPSGRAITGLQPSSFSATLGDADLPVASLDTSGSGARISTSIVLLVDVSGSMYGESIVQARTALQEFVRGVDPADQVAVLSFSDGVTQLQDFTTNRSQLNSAITRLTAFGDTALYDAVTQATQKAASSTATRKLVVLLSDGVSTVNNGQRDTSIEAARNSGVTVLPVGLGTAIDREYLQAIADVTGGSFVEASTAASLSETYANLAAAIKSRYTAHFTVPLNVDRTVAAPLTIRMTSGSQTWVHQQTLPPLAGALPPSFTFQLTGIRANQVVGETRTIKPAFGAGVGIASVEYLVNGESVHAATEDPFTFPLDPQQFEPGTYLIKALATDSRGGVSESEIAFRIAAPPGKNPLATVLPLLFGLLLLGGIGYGGYRVIAGRLARQEAEGNADNIVRIRPFAQKSTEEMQPPEEWPERPVPAPQPVSNILGRIVVMDESAIREGDLSTIREYSIGTAPLTLGAGSTCDIQLEEVENLAMEEARLWVQKGRLVYHKLTTLSAMATEGVTSGWLLLASGEEIHLGKYRLLFQAEIPASTEEPIEPGDQEPNKQFVGWSS